MNIDVFTEKDLMMLVFFAVSFTTVIAIMMTLLRQSQRHNKDLIRTMRDSYEKQIYFINDKLTASMERWQDVNHLVLGSQAALTPTYPSKRVNLSAFLKANGLRPDDIEPEPDLVFVLTPFNDRFDPVFDKIRNTCQSVGLKCLRGDEMYIQGDILPHILSLLAKAPIIIASIDGRNPNVFYELGLAHAMDKYTLLVAKTVEDIPIDVKSKKIIVYKNLKDIGPMLKDELLRLAYLKQSSPNKSEIPVKVGSEYSRREEMIISALLTRPYRLFFNPKIPGLSKTKIMRFAPNGLILDGQNQNESTWRIRHDLLELIDSNGEVHSRFYFNPDENRFIQTNDPDSGTFRKHGIKDQYMVPEE